MCLDGLLVQIARAGLFFLFPNEIVFPTQDRAPFAERGCPEGSKALVLAGCRALLNNIWPESRVGTRVVRSVAEKAQIAAKQPENLGFFGWQIAVRRTTWAQFFWTRPGPSPSLNQWGGGIPAAFKP